MAWLPLHLGTYPDAAAFERAWSDLAEECGARTSVAGYSVLGRPLPRYDFGKIGGPVVLLTGLIHAIELIGSMALLDFMRAAVREREARDGLLQNAHIVVLPIVSPDSLHANSDRLQGGRRAYKRGNANGVDLNRNFPRMARRAPLHPFAGSRFRASPHFVGAHPFSEPETRAVRDVALSTRPAVSVGFHSFGNMLLYPWAFTSKPNPRVARYQRIGAAFRRAQPRLPYALLQAQQLYATVGDMDDWLDAELGTLAFTVEVSRPGGMWRPSRLLNPFCWMNPADVGRTVSNVTPGMSALVGEALAA